MKNVNNYPIVKEYNLSLIDNLPYKLGSTFDENNIDLELRMAHKGTSVYCSYRHSELFLFGNIYESKCYLWFAKDYLLSINYKMENKHFDFFKAAINSDLPNGYELEKNYLEEENLYTVSIDDITISLQCLDENFFLLNIAYHDRF